MVQLRNVPEDLHRRLKAEAAMEGTSLSEYLIKMIREVAVRPTFAELSGQLRRRGPIDVGMPAAELIRSERDERQR